MSVTRISDGNSTTTLLGPNGTFIGQGEEVVAQSGIRVYVRQSGGKSATLGCKLQWSHDGTIWRDIDQDKFTVFDSTVRSIIRPIRARFFRMHYTNGPNAQLGFQLQTMLSGEADLVNDIESETRILPSQERSGRVVVVGSNLLGPGSVNSNIITAQGGRLYIKTIVYSAFNEDVGPSFGEWRIRDGTTDKIRFVLPYQMSAPPGDVPKMDGTIDFGDTPMTFNTSVNLFIPAGVAGVGVIVALSAHGYEEFLI